VASGSKASTHSPYPVVRDGSEAGINAGMAINKSKQQRLKERVSAERAAAGERRVRFSKQVQQEAVALAMTAQLPREELATAIGVGKTSLHAWITAAHGSKRQRRTRAKLHRVEITGGSPCEQTAELRLTFPSGAQLSGLSLLQLRALLGVSP
jgi:transposase-like protein